MFLVGKLLLVVYDVVNGLLHIGDLFRLIVRNLALELFFECHHKFHRIQRIRAEVVNERRFVLDVSFIDAQLLSNDLSDALFDIFHQDAPLKVNV